MSAVRLATASTRPPQKPPTSTCGTEGGRKRARGAAAAVIAGLLGLIAAGGGAAEKTFSLTPPLTTATSLVTGNKAWLNLSAKLFRRLVDPFAAAARLAGRK